jgi:hypothetical protein
MARVQVYHSTLRHACKSKLTMDILEGTGYSKTRRRYICSRPRQCIQGQQCSIEHPCVTSGFWSSPDTSTLPCCQHCSALSVLSVSSTAFARSSIRSEAIHSTTPALPALSGCSVLLLLTFTFIFPLRVTGSGAFRHKRVYYMAFRIHSVFLESQKSATQQLLTTSQPRHGRRTRARAFSAHSPLSGPIRG